MYWIRHFRVVCQQTSGISSLQILRFDIIFLFFIKSSKKLEMATCYLNCDYQNNLLIIICQAERESWWRWRLSMFINIILIAWILYVFSFGMRWSTPIYSRYGLFDVNLLPTRAFTKYFPLSPYGMTLNDRFQFLCSSLHF